MKKRILALVLVLVMASTLLPARAASNEEIVWSYFKAQGFSDAAAAGIIGNLHIESGCSPINLSQTANNHSGYSDEGFTAAVDSGEISRSEFMQSTQFSYSGEYAYGIAQWMYHSRKGNLYDYAQSKGVSIGDMTMQLEFLLQEMGHYSALDDYKNSTDPEDAAYEFCVTFEGTYHALSNRQSYAAEVYEKYSGKPLHTAAPTPTVKPTPTPTPTPEPTPTPKPTVGGFQDVFEGDYYANPVLWAVNKGVTTGTSKTHFSPNGECTRAQMVTFLWRVSGQPEPASNVNPFDDVPDGKYYTKAVLWAVEQGITKGTGDDTFSPDKSCNRAQALTFLWRASGEPTSTVTENPFKDVKAGKYYYAAVLWAIQQGVTTGKTARKFAPGADCTRAQIVTFLYRDQASKAPD